MKNFETKAAASKAAKAAKTTKVAKTTAKAADPERTLAEIRKQLKEIDGQRAEKQLTEEQRDTLEMAAVAMRDAERIAIAKVQKQIVDNMAATTAELNGLSKLIRARVKKMNKFPKGVAKVETVLSEVVKILSAVAEWAD